VVNPDQTDTDDDGIGDACDTDDDNDGLSDTAEAAAGTDPLDPDTDNDGVLDGADQCALEPETVNGFQDTDGCPDVAPPGDADGDGVPDGVDQCPTVPGPATNNGCPVTTEQPVGGELLGIDATSLLIAGALGNSGWILPVAAVTSAGIIGLLLRKKLQLRNQES
jgi:hypothetical protein